MAAAVCTPSPKAEPLVDPTILGNLVLRKVVQSVSAYYLVHHILGRLDIGEDEERSSRKAAATAILRRLDNGDDTKRDNSSDNNRRQRKEDLVLNQYEQRVALDVVAPEDIPVSFDGTCSYRNLLAVSDKVFMDRHWWLEQYNRRA